jgi:hypothetical protein
VGGGTPERKKFLLRLDPAMHDALVRWASDELRSTNAQIEFLLSWALRHRTRLSAATPGDSGADQAPQARAGP